MRPYATADDLGGWLPAEAAARLEAGDTERILLRASEVVAEHVTTGYALNTEGDAADADTATALRDATCAQVEQWLEVGEENDVAGYSRGASLSVGGLSVSSMPRILAPRARRILRIAGLNSAVMY